MSAQLKVSLHHVATWSHSSIHHSPCCLYREEPCHRHKAYRKVAGRNVHHFNASERPSQALIVTNVLRSKQFEYADLTHSNTMQYVLTLSEHASFKVLFVLLWCIHSNQRLHVWNYTSQAEVTPPLINPSCWQPAGRRGCGARRAMKAILLTTSLCLNWTVTRPAVSPLTPVIGLVALSWY